MLHISINWENALPGSRIAIFESGGDLLAVWKERPRYPWKLGGRPEVCREHPWGANFDNPAQNVQLGEEWKLFVITESSGHIYQNLPLTMQVLYKKNAENGEEKDAFFSDFLIDSGRWTWYCRKICYWNALSIHIVDPGPLYFGRKC